MILFAAYAVVIWYFAMRWRRRALGFAVAIVGGLPVFLAARHVPMLASLGGSALRTPGRGMEALQVLLWGEAAAVMGVALFIACLPRPPRTRHCSYCWYDLSGLDAETDVCPECGTPRHGYHTRPAPTPPPAPPQPPPTM